MPTAFSTIRTRVQYLLGTNVAISTAELNALINAEHEGILGDNPWAEKKAESTITTIAPYSTGTVSTTSTAVTGSGTTFTSAMVGRYIRFGTDQTYYKITAFGSVTGLTIETAVASGDVSAGSTYSIFKNVYALPSDLDRILSMAYRDPLTEITRQDLDRLDPDRTVTATDPRYWCMRELDSSNVRQVELWPVPTGAVLVRFQYTKTNTLSSDSDVPLYRSDVLVWKSAASGAYLLYAKTGDEAWINLGDRFLQNFERQLSSALLDDVGRNSPNHRVRDVLYDPVRGGPYYDRDNSWGL